MDVMQIERTMLVANAGISSLVNQSQLPRIMEHSGYYVEKQRVLITFRRIFNFLFHKSI